MTLIVRDGRIECPICDVVLTVTKPGFEVAVMAAHAKNECAWSGKKYRVNPNTGFAVEVSHG